MVISIPLVLYDHVKKLVRMEKYDQALLDDYTREEWDTGRLHRSLA